jgi:hypothetical protein
MAPPDPWAPRVPVDAERSPDFPRSMKLWLDDRRPAPAGWTRAHTVAEAQAYLQTGGVDEASLDHDLGACEACMGGLSVEEWAEAHDWDMPHCEHLGTGYSLCVWMEETGYWPKQKPRVHSMNHRGSARMQAIIDRRFQGSRQQ